MSILTEILLLCDGGFECPPFNLDVAKCASLVTATSLRVDAHNDGWVKVGRKDYCDACAERLGLNN